MFISIDDLFKPDSLVKFVANADDSSFSIISVENKRFEGSDFDNTWIIISKDDALRVARAIIDAYGG